LNQLELETVKREKPRAEDVAKSDAESDEAPTPQPRFEAVIVEEAASGPAAEGSGLNEAGKKRKRRRKKKKSGADAAAVHLEGEVAAPTDEEPVKEQEPLQESVRSDEQGAPLDELASKPKKRRRRRGRKGTKTTDEGVIDDSVSSDALPAEAVSEVIVAVNDQLSKVEAETPGVQEKPKRTRNPRTKKPVEALPVLTEAVAVEPVVESVAAPKKPRRPPVKKTIEAAPVGVEAPIEPAKRATRPRRPKKAVETP
jgi:ribonuclease E